MITHEEAYKAHCNAIIGQTADEVDKNHDIVKQYMKQQEKKDKLLELYRNLSMETDVLERVKYWERITKIELEELE